MNSRPTNHGYEEILNSLATGVFTVDQDFAITFFNTQAENMTGYTKEEALGQKCWTIFRTDHCERHCNLKKAMENDAQLVNIRVKMSNRHGRKIPVAITAAVLRDQEGNIVGGVESFQDDRVRNNLEKQIKASYTMEDFITKDERIWIQLEKLPTIAQSSKPVLILGETGVGKDVLAKVIHNLSPRRAGPFIKVNCAAIPENMLEAELFGYKKGAFTDAKQDKPGKFQLAQSGTIFLDEISELRYDMQAKLLQALEDKEVFPLGGISIENINARVIAATNRDLNKLIEMNAFRRDLYYRLKLCEFFIPPLRDRLMDIPLLLDHFISEAAVTSNKKIYGISHEAKRLLMEYSYPGNIREMKNIIEYAVLVTQETIEVHDLPSYLLNQGTEPRYYILDSQRPFTLEEGEKATLYKALEANNWHIQHAADNLGINRTTLWRKMKRFNLSRERE